MFPQFLACKSDVWFLPNFCDIYKICCMMFYVYMKCTYLELFGYTCIIFMYLFFGMSDSSPQHLTHFWVPSNFGGSPFSVFPRQQRVSSWQLLASHIWHSKMCSGLQNIQNFTAESVWTSANRINPAVQYGEIRELEIIEIRFEVRCVCLKSAFFPVEDSKNPRQSFERFRRESVVFLVILPHIQYADHDLEITNVSIIKK